MIEFLSVSKNLSELSDLRYACEGGCAPRYSLSYFVDLSRYRSACCAWGADSMEIVIKTAAGFTSADPRKRLLKPGVHYIDLVGSKKYFNEAFRMAVETNNFGTGAEASPLPVMIRPYE